MVEQSGNASIAIPKLTHHPLASLGLYPIEFRVAGENATIPALSALPWLEVLMMGEHILLDDVVPGLLDDPSIVEDALTCGDLHPYDLEDLQLKAIELASGRDWWVTLRLIETIRGAWDQVGSEFAMVDANRISLAGWLDFAFGIILKAMPRDKLQSFLLRLEIPPKSIEAPEPTISAEQFLAMM